MKCLTLKAAILCSVMLAPSYLLAQSTTEADPAASASTEDTSGLLTPEELQTLVGPVALYPDTLLIQVLVASTYPMDVMKAERLLKDNVGVAPEDLKLQIDAQGWDESVAMLAAAFPDVLNEMAVHIDWTEAMGNAMLAQSEDVMEAAQVMREIANENGALVSGEEQTVEVTQEDNGDQTIVIQPTDPAVVYVPQYSSNTVYVKDNSTSDAVATGLIAFGTFVVMDAIFSRNDPWNSYWGCRNCGGWHGKPVVRNPRNVNINGNVNIGNNVGWKADSRRQQQARNDISRHRGPNGATTMPINRPNRGNEMRANLSRQSGARDISRDRSPRASVAGSGQAGNRASGLSAGNRNGAVARSGASGGKRAGASGGNRNAVRKPQKAARAPSHKPRASSGGAMNHRSSAPKARSGGARGRASSGGGRRR